MRRNHACTFFALLSVALLGVASGCSVYGDDYCYEEDYYDDGWSASPSYSGGYIGSSYSYGHGYGYGHYGYGRSPYRDHDFDRGDHVRRGDRHDYSNGISGDSRSRDRDRYGSSRPDARGGERASPQPPSLRREVDRERGNSGRERGNTDRPPDRSAERTRANASRLSPAPSNPPAGRSPNSPRGNSESNGGNDARPSRSPRS